MGIKRGNGATARSDSEETKVEETRSINVKSRLWKSNRFLMLPHPLTNSETTDVLSKWT